MNATKPAWPAASAAELVDGLFAWLTRTGAGRYDEAVTQLDHGLQCAYLADRAGDGDTAVAAALLHDVGHLLLDEHDARATFLEKDLAHEAIGAGWLAQMFPADVANPVREHVRAKRYLCTVDPDYLGRLSRASTRSFELQGGALSAEEIAALEAQPGFAAALTLRRRDDGAKVAGRPVPGLEHYRDLLESLVQL
jgi:phosphonate degradation associated HDIG domain protein